MQLHNELKIMLFAAHLYQQGGSQKDIAKQLNLTESKVSRLLKRSRDYVELRYNVPGDRDLEMKLIHKFGLIDAVVIETGSRDIETAIVGQAAARFFIENVKDKDCVALSCGSTLQEMLKALPTLSHLRLEIAQLSVEGDPELIHQAPSTLVGLLRAKCSPDSYVYGIQLPPLEMTAIYPDFREQMAHSKKIIDLRDMVMKANYLFIGIGLPQGSEQPKSHSQKILADRVANTENSGQLFKNTNIIGEINNQYFDIQGRDQTAEIRDFIDHTVNIISLSDLKSIAENRKEHKVVAVATGCQKANAIKIALKTGYANIIVTGRDTAELILD